MGLKKLISDIISLVKTFFHFHILPSEICIFVMNNFPRSGQLADDHKYDFYDQATRTARITQFSRKSNWNSRKLQLPKQ